MTEANKWTVSCYIIKKFKYFMVNRVTPIQFVPSFTVQSGLLQAAPQGQPLSVKVSVIEKSVQNVAAGVFQLAVSASDLPLIEHLYADNDEIGFQIDPTQQEIIFSPLPRDLTLSLYRTPQATFSILNGALPNGLELSDSGTISGTAEQIYPDNQTFTFTVRAQNEYAVRDREFAIAITGAATAAFFNPATLPKQVSTPVAGYTYGDILLGESIWISLDVIQRDFDIPSIRLIATEGLVASANVFDGLPEGVLFEQGQIRGRVALDATPGTYVMTFLLEDDVQPSRTSLFLNVLPTRVQSVDLPPLLVWTTPQGALADQTSFLPCCALVSALSNGIAPTYSLSPFSEPLPSGLSLDPTTGAIGGSPDYVAGSQVFDLLIRATVGFAFIERDFSIRVSSAFLSPNVASVYAALDPVQSAVEIAGLSDIIPTSVLFHAGDAQFGLQRRPTLSLISGLVAPASTRVLTGQDKSAIGHTGYYYEITLITGQLSCVSVNDSTGQPLYDVILRLLHDPNDGAGGFSLDQNSDLVRQAVIKQSGASQRNVYSNSINNIRMDLIDKLGFQATASKRIGPSTPELLQPWMNGSFKLALPLVYLLPGNGQIYLRRLIKSTAIAPIGNRIDLNKLFIRTPKGRLTVQLR